SVLPKHSLRDDGRHGSGRRLRRPRALRGSWRIDRAAGSRRREFHRVGGPLVVVGGPLVCTVVTVIPVHTVAVGCTGVVMVIDSLPPVLTGTRGGATAVVVVRMGVRLSGKLSTAPPVGPLSLSHAVSASATNNAITAAPADRCDGLIVQRRRSS